MRLFQRTGFVGGGPRRLPARAGPPPRARLHPRPDPSQAMADRLPTFADPPGLVGAGLADLDSGLPLAVLGDRLDPEAMAASATHTLRTALRVAEGLGTDDRPEEVLALFGHQVHFLRPLDAAPGVLLHLVLDRARTNLGIVRMRLRTLDPAA